MRATVGTPPSTTCTWKQTSTECATETCAHKPANPFRGCGGRLQDNRRRTTSTARRASWQGAPESSGGGTNMSGHGDQNASRNAGPDRCESDRSRTTPHVTIPDRAESQDRDLARHQLDCCWATSRPGLPLRTNWTSTHQGVGRNPVQVLLATGLIGLHGS